MKFFKELKKRNVYKAGVAYVVTGWLLLQIVDVVGPGFGWPESATALLTKILLVGLPIALVLAWLYELTPKGFQRTGSYQEETADNRKAGRRLNYFIIGILSVAVCFLLVDKLFLSDSSNDNQEASIAVLPFDFLSTADSLAFMSEALSGAISDKLGKVSGLVVTGKTSSAQFKDYGGTIQEIGKKLNTNYLMEGDLRLERNRIRLSTRLVNTLNGRVKWQKQYDQDFESVMDLEEDIADNVVRELRVEVFPDEFLRLRKRVSENSEAYRLYLQGAQLGQKRTKESLTEAISLIEEAIILEPEFAKAHAELVILYHLLFNYADLDRDVMIEKMKEHNEIAQSIDTDLPEVNFAASRVAIILERDTSKTLAHLRKAIQLNESYAPAYYGLANQLGRLGMQERSFKALKKAYNLDPYNDLYAQALAGVYTNRDKKDMALEILNLQLNQDPSSWASALEKGRILRNAPYGDLAQAFITLHRANENGNDEAYLLAALVGHSLGLDLAPVARRYMRLLQLKYPNNEITFHLQFNYNQFTNNERENIDLIDVWSSKGVHPAWITNYLAETDIGLNKVEEAEKSLRSQYSDLSRSIDSLNSHNSLDFSNFGYETQLFIEIFKAKNNDSLADLLVERHFENRSDPNDDLRYFYFKENVDSVVQIMRNAWFEEKNRQDFQLLLSIKAGRYRNMENAPDFKKFTSELLQETHRMRAEVIEYLKEEGDWDPAWDKELGLE